MGFSNSLLNKKKNETEKKNNSAIWYVNVVVSDFQNKSYCSINY